MFGRKFSYPFLLSFSFRISASNAICAPQTWQQGDLRRPYPTDIEMRLGFLGKSDASVNGHSSQVPASSTADVPKSAEIPTTTQNQFAWLQSGELHMTVGSNAGSGTASVPLDTRAQKKDAEDVEVMSTDSSSSSSSDSQ